MLRQSQDLKLSAEQTEKIKTITDQYERTRRDRETAYKRSEMEALKLIHDNRSSLLSIESAVHKADQEHIELLLRIGGKAAAQVDIGHFGSFAP